MTPNSSANAEQNTAAGTNPLLNWPLTLREEIRCHVRGQADAAVLEDPVAGKHYRVGPAEYRFIVHANRSTCFADAWRRFETSCVNSPPPITRNQGEVVYSWLIASGCSEGSSSVKSRSAPPLWRRVNPLVIRLSLGNPDRLLTRLALATQRVDARAAALCIGFLLFAAAWILLTNFGQFIADVDRLITSDRVVVLCGLWCLLKVIHELGHGLVCKRFGGRVTDVGVAFILFAPVAYTDVSSSSAFPSRTRRLAVALAGVTFELCVAAVAVLLWRITESPDIRRAAVDAALMASVTTLAFNANPLMRYDGYYVLVDCFGIDNLYEKGQLAIRQLFGRVLAATANRSMELNGRFLALAGYGLACWLWRLGLGLTLIVASASLLHGAGWVLATFAACTWFIAPAVDWIRKCLRAPPWRRQSKMSVALRLVGVAAAGVAVCLVPPPVFSTAPAVVQSDPPALIRCRTAGFVKAVHVSDGQRVCCGDPILTLYDELLANELSAIEVEWQLSMQQERSCQWRGDASQLLTARANTARLQEERAELRRRAAGLVIRAGADGAVAARRIGDFEGVYLSEGECIGEVGIPESKRLVVSLLPADAEQLSPGHRVRAITPSGDSFEGTVSRVEPRAGVEPPHPSIDAVHDGPIAVNLDKANRKRFVRPRVTAYVDLPPAASLRLRSGQTCTVLLGPRSQTLFDWGLSRLRGKLGL